ncbi:MULTISPECIES: DUF1499 domain-containing protein [unclassified Pseudodesulfovibrio]|uniref:DUF1499 domain-containing protein n=1 Tax=unclassified Pseudodesulfovibrio TaxID=2661612 RepID=UPI000FEB86FE|nr:MULTISPECIES: DUF1499 domain-containing protein [unclassified Pseudodesulfovibrio]MCJ2164865.1 DUF1499 domain-containing protein [Pseudodesulfovibrio sp. S3-i]RWU03850.1 DUF1499 domain-containing protein [Pseudodesulfovibrio sp. S3]
MKYILIGVALSVIGLLGLSRLSNRLPNGLGVSSGQLAQCPSSKNCVSSQSSDREKRVAPIKASGPSDIVMADLIHAIESMKGGRITALDGRYLRAEFTSRVWRFVDDLECYHDVEHGIIHVRSASRVGYSDFGTNRKRVEELRANMTAE